MIFILRALARYAMLSLARGAAWLMDTATLVVKIELPVLVVSDTPAVRSSLRLPRKSIQLQTLKDVKEGK